MQYGLIGLPNVGKTTWYNRISGAQAKVGNYEGVTVTANQASVAGTAWYDLPGIYDLNSQVLRAKDQQLTYQYLLQPHFNWVFFVDVLRLQQSFYLLQQLIDLDLPLVVVLANLQDADQARKLKSHIVSQLQLEVYEFDQFQAVRHANFKIAAKSHYQYYPSAMTQYLQSSRLNDQAPQGYFVVPAEATSKYHFTTLELTAERYEVARQWAQKIGSAAIRQQKLDRWLLHRWLAPVWLVFTLYALFASAILLGGRLQTYLNVITQNLLVTLPQYYAALHHWPAWLAQPLLTGVGKALSTTLGFIPIITVLFFALGFLEQSGYIARAILIVDRWFAYLRLPGRALVPMLLGFGCNVPAILATRSLPKVNQRIVVALMTPFMSCGARLAVFSLFAAMWFKQQAVWIIIFLYGLGIGAAFVTAWYAQRWLGLTLAYQPAASYLPRYRWPKIGLLWRQTWIKVWGFCVRALRWIAPISVFISLANYWSWSGQPATAEHASILVTAGHQLVPLFHPLGLSDAHWPAIIALLTGLVAKEVVIGTFNTLLAQQATWSNIDYPHAVTWWQHLQHSSGSRLHAWLQTFAWDDGLQLTTQAQHYLQHAFQHPLTLIAYLTFVLLYVPCISTIAALAKEVGSRWAWFAVFWSTGLAYGLAVIIYQMGQWQTRPYQVLLILSGVAVFWYGMMVLGRYLWRSHDPVHGY